jgi:hypothetical protein
MPSTTIALIGSFAFGLVIGWITYRTLRRREGGAQLSDIAAVVGAVGGGVVTTLPFSDPDVFGAYAIGLAVGFFAYAVIALAIARSAAGTPAEKAAAVRKEAEIWLD